MAHVVPQQSALNQQLNVTKSQSIPKSSLLFSIEHQQQHIDNCYGNNNNNETTMKNQNIDDNWQFTQPQQGQYTSNEFMQRKHSPNRVLTPNVLDDVAKVKIKRNVSPISEYTINGILGMVCSEKRKKNQIPYITISPKENDKAIINDSSVPGNSGPLNTNPINEHIQPYYNSLAHLSLTSAAEYNESITHPTEWIDHTRNVKSTDEGPSKDIQMIAPSSSREPLREQPPIESTFHATEVFQLISPNVSC